MDTRTRRDELIEELLVDSAMARRELTDALDRGDVCRIRACLLATNRRAASDIRLAWWFAKNGAGGVWRYLRTAWIVGWRQGRGR